MAVGCLEKNIKITKWNLYLGATVSNSSQYLNSFKTYHRNTKENMFFKSCDVEIDNENTT